MKVTSISYGRTYNTGNYTSQRFEATASVDEDEENPWTALQTLKHELDAAAADMVSPLYGKPAPATATEGDDVDIRF